MHSTYPPDYINLLHHVGLHGQDAVFLSAGGEALIAAQGEHISKIYMTNQFTPPQMALDCMQTEARALSLLSTHKALRTIIPKLLSEQYFTTPYHVGTGTPHQLTFVGALHMSRMKGGMLTSDVYNRLSSRKLSQIYTQMGAALALLHEAATSRPVAQFASQNFKPIHRHLEPLLHQESCHLTEKERQTVIEIYDRQQQTQPEQHLCHGDAHSGNFLFDAYGRVTALLDFGQAGYGSPAIDFFHAMEHGPFSITGNSYKKNGKQPPIQQSVREQRILCLAYCILNHEKHVYRQGLEGEMPIELKTTALHPLKAEIRAYNKPSPRQSAHGLG